MRRFRKSNSETDPPVRHDQVMKLLNLRMRESDAGDRELDPCDPSQPTPDFDRAKAALEAEQRRSTRAEIRSANETARRHGYS